MGVKGSRSTPWPHLPRFVIMNTEDWSYGIDPGDLPQACPDCLRPFWPIRQPTTLEAFGVSLIAPGEHPLAGLSTDLYFPSLPDLFGHLRRTPPDYIEIFRGRTVDLREARNTLPESLPLTYHGDCLWYTQPDYATRPAFREEERRAIRHMDALNSPWMIHECAQKSMAGFDFGLYAPPLLTMEGARAAREGALSLARALGDRLLLVETPPFPPHPPGDIDLASFFDILVKDSPLAIGLDLGHCLTYLAASGHPIDIETALEWLDSFPLERVVEIHTGGMHFLPLDGSSWPVDDHAFPLPDLLFDLLEKLLSRLSLPSLQGVALEVDNKEAGNAAREFLRFREIVRAHSRPGGTPLPSPTGSSPLLTDYPRHLVREQYAHLARALSGAIPSPYSRHLYDSEIWEFGGNMSELFPETLSILSLSGIDVRQSFVEFFNRVPHESSPGQDFLEIKIRRTAEWLDNLSTTGHALHPSLRAVHQREADLLLHAQHLYNGDPNET